MPSTQAQLRATLRQRLRDEDPTSYRWPDGVLNGHLQSALRLVAARRPRAASLTKAVPLSPRRVDLSADVGPTFLWLEALEYPLDRDPLALLPFWEEPGPRAHLFGPALPAAGDQLRVWYAAGYAVDEATSDLPANLDEVVLDGASALALEDQAAAALAGPSAGDGLRHRRELAASTRARFEAHLAGLPARAVAPTWRLSWCSPM